MFRTSTWERGPHANGGSCPFENGTQKSQCKFKKSWFSLNFVESNSKKKKCADQYEVAHVFGFFFLNKLLNLNFININICG